MPKRKQTAEEIKLSEAEVIIATGSTVAEAARRIGVSGADLLPVAGRVRRSSGGPGPAPEAVGDREQPAQVGGSGTQLGQPATQGGS